MTDHVSNDNDVRAQGQPRGPDAHGQAAILLVESLLHGLISRSVISAADGVEIEEIAAEVKEEVAADLGDSPSTMQKSLNILNAIGQSLHNDLPGK